MTSREEITRTLVDAAQGDALAAERLTPLLYKELKAIADRYMQRERLDHTLQATALLNQAFVQLFEHDRLEPQSKRHFLALAANKMRHILVDHARQRDAAKRGGDRPRVALHDDVAQARSSDDVDILALNEALVELEKLNDRQARVVELRYFAGMSIEETAHALGVSKRTVNDDWDFARRWLKRKLAD